MYAVTVTLWGFELSANFCDGMRFFSPRNCFCSAVLICILFIWYYVVKLRELVDSDGVPVAFRANAGTFPLAKWPNAGHKSRGELVQSRFAETLTLTLTLNLNPKP